MDIPNVAAVADAAESSANVGDRAATASFEQALRESGGSNLERLPPELQQNVAQRLSPADLSHLSQTSKRMTASLRPKMTEAEVTASAQKVNTLAKLRQLVGQAPVRRSQNWQPQHILQELSADQRVRPQLVMAARVNKIRPADRDAAEQLVRGQATLATAQEIDSSMRNLMGAGQSLVERRGASVPDAAQLFGYDREAPMMRYFYQENLEDAGREMGKQAVSAGEPVDRVVSLLGLNEYSREELERHAAEVSAQSGVRTD